MFLFHITPSDSNLSKVLKVKASNKMIANYKKQDEMINKISVVFYPILFKLNTSYLTLNITMS
jgi:hypothetical protein